MGIQVQPDQKIDPTATPTADFPEHSAGVRIGAELLRATKPFIEDSRAKSWRLVSLSFILLLAALAGAGMVAWWPLRLLLSVLGALLMVRVFITYHDFLHSAILSGSRPARWLFQAYGAFALAPSSSWKKSHNYHHGHVGQISTASVGAFPMMTAEMWSNATSAQRFSYRFQRHPLVVLLGYITIFGFSVTLLPLLSEPRRHLDSAIAVVLHGGLIAALWILAGFDVAFFAVILPMAIASALGSYLFFAQHSCEYSTGFSRWSIHKQKHSLFRVTGALNRPRPTSCGHCGKRVLCRWRPAWR